MSEQNYKAIADRLVERGIGERDQPNLPHSNQMYYYAPDTHPDEPNDDEGFCHDWRVAGACMERMSAEEFVWTKHPKWWEVSLLDCDDTCYSLAQNESLPLAIILAYLEVTDDD